MKHRAGAGDLLASHDLHRVLEIAAVKVDAQRRDASKLERTPGLDQAAAGAHVEHADSNIGRERSHFVASRLLPCIDAAIHSASTPPSRVGSCGPKLSPSSPSSGLRRSW